MPAEVRSSVGTGCQKWQGDLLPTALGNTLRRGETRAGERYQLDLTVALPRLTPLMAPGVLAELSDLRNQLDAAARLCIAAGIATAVSVGLLIWHGPWLFLALATYPGDLGVLSKRRRSGSKVLYQPDSGCRSLPSAALRRAITGASGRPR